MPDDAWFTLTEAGEAYLAGLDDASRCDEDEPAASFTVKRVDIFGAVHDTHATEGELNGWRPTQGAMQL